MLSVDSLLLCEGPSIYWVANDVNSLNFHILFNLGSRVYGCVVVNSLKHGVFYLTLMHWCLGCLIFNFSYPLMLTITDIKS